jgi:IS1 family transposase
MVSMNKLTTTKRIQVVRCLVEGNSVRATVRVTGVAKNTIAKLIVDLGEACLDYQDEHLRNLPCKRVQCDEIWSFVGAKAKNVPTEHKTDGWGDIWTWTAIDADTKLVPCWMVGNRDFVTAKQFIGDLASRLSKRVQLSTDGHRPYLMAVEEIFGSEIDYAQIIKVYGAPTGPDTRYSATECIGMECKAVTGNPDPKHMSTSFVERQNLTMRMSMRRFTRLTNAFSKKIENHMAAIALHFMYYNFARIHQSLRMTPAMAAGVTNKLWDVEDIVALLEPKSEVEGLVNAAVDSN